MMRSRLPRFLEGVSLDLGRLVAEEDDRLREYYVGRDRYVARALDASDPAIFFVGPKGVGKSAILQMVRLERETDAKRIINVSPDDLAFSALANIEIKNSILQNAGRNQWLFASLWDYVLSVEILRREFPGTSRLKDALALFFGKDCTKQAKKLLSSSVEAEGETKTFTHRMLELIEEVELAGKLDGVELSGRIVLREGGRGKTQQLQLLSQVNSVAKDLHKVIHHEYYLLIDDLDLHWANTPVQNALIAALFLSLRRLSRTQNLRTAVALREDIFRDLPLEDKDKLRDRVCRVRWDNATVKRMVADRIVVLIGCSREAVWSELFPDHLFAQVLKHTRGLPREAIRAAVLCLEETQMRGRNCVELVDVRTGIERFSNERLEDLDSEQRHRLPGIRALVERLKGQPLEFDLKEFTEFVLKTAVDVEENAGRAGSYSWAAGFLDNPAGLARELLDCGVLLYKANRKALPQPVARGDSIEIGQSTWLAIHPMYAPALGHRVG